MSPIMAERAEHVRINHLFEVVRSDMSNTPLTVEGVRDWDLDAQESWAAELPKLLDRVEELHDFYQDGDMDGEQVRLYDQILPTLIAYSASLAEALEVASRPPQPQAVELHPTVVHVDVGKSASRFYATVVPTKKSKFGLRVKTSKKKSDLFKPLLHMLKITHK